VADCHVDLAFMLGERPQGRGYSGSDAIQFATLDKAVANE